MGERYAIKQARELREDGLTYDAIGRRLGVGKTTVWRWLNPEAAKAENANRRPAQRAYERAKRAKRACGALLGPGSAYPSHARTRCAACHRAEEAERVAVRGHKIERFWAQGLSLREIADEFVWMVNHLTVEMHGLRAKGFDLPYRYTTGLRAGGRSGIAEEGS